MRACRVILAIAIAAASLSCHGSKHWPLVIVLGIDGMDPVFVQQHISALPNLRRLIKDGEFKRLQTTMPPQSPVAWSTFSTGLDPIDHGIFDFVYRDPATKLPFSAMGETEPPPFILPLGSYQIPVGSPHVRNLRQGRVFWQLLSDAGVPVRILRMPVNYPPAPVGGQSLSGMGVPDLRGTVGTFTYFTDSLSDSRRNISGGDVVPAQITDDRTQLSIIGPPNPLRKDGRASKVSLDVRIDPFENVALFTVQDHSFILKGGQWSDWIPVHFLIIPRLKSAHGMIRVYAKSLRPDFEVYVSPVNFDPSQPDTVLTSPASYSSELATSIGAFYTQGMPEDTSAYRDGIFDRQEYLEQSRLVSADEIKLLKQGLIGFNAGLFFLHFSGIDQNSHMLWRKFDDELLQTYKLVDDAVGWVMNEHPDARLMVMSDHGFSTFDRAVNINTWLLQEGLQNQAYVLGLNALYLDLIGRERNGEVSRADAPALLRDLGDKLLKLRDPANNNQVVARVWSPHSDFQGDIKFVPDLIIGFTPGYRESWDGALGNASEQVISENRDAWIGDHCIAPEYVPGVLISNRKSHESEPRLKDLTTSLLALYGVRRAAGMDGKVIY